MSWTRRRASGIRCGSWCSSRQLDGLNPTFPLYDTEDVTLRGPAGPLNVRFRVTTDQLIGSRAYLGTWVDDVPPSSSS